MIRAQATNNVMTIVVNTKTRLAKQIVIVVVIIAQHHLNVAVGILVLLVTPQVIVATVGVEPVQKHVSVLVMKVIRAAMIIGIVVGISIAMTMEFANFTDNFLL